MYLQSISAYADDILDQLPAEEIEYLKSLDGEDDLAGLHLSWGMGIRNGCGLWDSQHPLTKHWFEKPEERDMRNSVDYSLDHPDQVSFEIMKAVYKKVVA